MINIKGQSNDPLKGCEIDPQLCPNKRIIVHIFRLLRSPSKACKSFQIHTNFLHKQQRLKKKGRKVFGPNALSHKFFFYFLRFLNDMETNVLWRKSFENGPF